MAVPQLHNVLDALFDEFLPRLRSFSDKDCTDCLQREKSNYLHYPVEVNYVWQEVVTFKVNLDSLHNS